MRKPHPASIYWLIATCLLLTGCETQSKPKLLTVENLNKQSTSVEEAKFTKLPSEETGVNSVNKILPDHPLSRLYTTGYAGGGVSIGDLNGDSKPDLFIVNGPNQNKLYLQTTAFKFKDHTANANLENNGKWGTGASLADIDNDGDLDIYLCNYDSPAQLFINDGKANFSEQAKRFGLDYSGACITPAFADYDRDGFLDVYILTNRLMRKEGIPKESAVVFKNGVPSVRPEYEEFYTISDLGGGRYEVDNAGQFDRLFRHNGSKKHPRYNDVSSTAGINSRAMGLSVRWWDYDDDGYLDIYVANDFATPDLLWRNNGDGTFSEEIAKNFPHTTWFSMGSDTGDINNDGYWDLLVADMAGSTHFKEKLAMGSMDADRFTLVEGPPPQLMRNALLLGSGTSRFLESAFLSGLAKTDWSWSVKLADLDNDGLLDAFFTNGSTRDFMDSDHLSGREEFKGLTEWEAFKNTPERREKNLAFQNQGELKFKDVSTQWGLDHLGMSYSAAHGDLDRDGDLDLVVMNLNEPVSIYRNDQKARNSVLIKLRGNQSNSAGLGARIQVLTPKGSLIRQMRNASGFNSGDEAIAHFGLGSIESISSIIVDWPSGVSQVFKKLPVNKLYTIDEPLSELSTPTWRRIDKEKPAPLFRQDYSLAKAKHSETKFDDFAKQPLLPNKLSQLGPAIAWGDIDGDLVPEFFQGGAKDQSAMLFRKTTDGSYKKLSVKVFNQDAKFEDMGAVFFDVDTDGDLDLYVVSGGVEAGSKYKLLKDRLYLNQGKGNFVKAPTDSLPNIYSSGGTVATADFDRDGDLDLFIGGRSQPSEYPSSPQSFLLRNDTTPGSTPKFSDVTQELAQGLTRTGMVTSALWTDIDADGWLELLLTREWGSIQVWKNNSGKFVDSSASSGLATHSGWWNSLTGADFDGDGDIDYVATNTGLNTKYTASPAHPLRLFYGAFAGERKRIIEAEYEDDTLYPMRGKGCSTKAMPELGEKFESFKEFAIAELDEIYTPEELQTADEYLCNSLESGVFINSGDGHFSFNPLPRLAQISPSFGVVATEVNGDGHSDIYLVQNFFNPQVETGRMDSGTSLLLLGKGDGSFNPVWPRESGLVVSGDAKSLTTVDLNNDAMVDFVTGVNDSSPQVFLNQSKNSDRFISLNLVGPPGNLEGIGARVSLIRSDGVRQTAEIYAGSGYLSQSSATLFFGLGSSKSNYKFEIQWPDGTSQVATPTKGQKQRVKYAID